MWPGSSTMAIEGLLCRSLHLPAVAFPEPRESVRHRHRVVDVSEQLGQLFGKVIRPGGTAIALQRVGGDRVAAGCAADREIDPLAVHPAQHAEVLRDFQRAVVGQHHPAAPHADARRRRADRGDQHFGARARQHRRRVMLGHPVSRVAKLLGVPREVDGVPQGVAASHPLGNGRLIQNAQTQRHDVIIIADAIAHLCAMRDL